MKTKISKARLIALRAYVEASGLTQEELAQRSGCTRRTISRLLTTGIAYTKTKKNFSEALTCSYELLFELPPVEIMKAALAYGIPKNQEDDQDAA